MTLGFSRVTLEARRPRSNAFESLKENYFKTRMLYQAKSTIHVSRKNDTQIRKV